MNRVIFFAAVMAASAVYAAPIDNMKLRFKISARDLPDKDTLGTIDPYVEIFSTEDGQKEETTLGRTGTLTDTENPDWGDVFEFDFSRAKRQRWHFKVYDHDNGREDDKAGHAYVDVADFVDKSQHLNLNLNKKGYLILSTVDPVVPAAPSAPAQVQQPQTVPVVPVVQHATVPLVPVTGGVVIVPQAPASKAPAPAAIQTTTPLTRIKFKLSANNLDDKDIYGTSDPYVKVYSKVGSEPETLISNTAKLTDTENPVWPGVIDYEYDPSKNPKLHFLVLDDDEGRRDDELGDAWLDVNEYVKKNQDESISLKKGSLNIRKV